MKGVKTKLNHAVKAQAALEFLTTYGWAFLVILIMIGALAYFGILSPSKILPDRCNLGSEFQCIDHQVTTTGIRLRLKSNVGEPIDVTSLSVGPDAGISLTCTPPTNPLGWKAGEVKELVWTVCSGGGLVKGEKARVILGIDYYEIKSGSNFARNVSGDVFTTIR